MNLDMSFNQAQYQAVIDEINAGLVTLAEKIGQIGPAATAAGSGWWIPQPAADALLWCADQIARLASEILETLKDIVQGALAPIFFAIKAYNWHDTITGPTSEVAANIAPNTLRACYTWQGEAATAYSRAVSSQTIAASKIQSVGANVASTLTIVAGAGLAFYIAIGILLAKVIAQVVAAIVVDGTMIAAAVIAIGAFLTAQVTALVGLKGQVESNEAFPSGQWPVGTL